MKQTLHILFLTFGFIFCSAQTVTVNGKLVLQNEDDRSLVIEKTKVVLEQNGIEKITKVNERLEFSFEINGFDEIQITTIPKGIGSVSGRYYSFKNTELRKTDTLSIEIPYSLTCKYDKSKNDRTCPVCSKQDKVFPIIYGLISDGVFTKEGEPIEKKKEYYSGGCIISECDPNWYCKRDDYEF